MADERDIHPGSAFYSTTKKAKEREEAISTVVTGTDWETIIQALEELGDVDEHASALALKLGELNFNGQVEIRDA